MSAVILVAIARPYGLTPGVTIGRLVGATVGSALLALAFAAIAFAIGAATGNRPAAISDAAALAVAAYVAEGLSHQVRVIGATRAGNPWHWLLADDPLRNGLTWHSWALPLAVTDVLAALSVPLLQRRDLAMHRSAPASRRPNARPRLTRSP